MSSHFPVFDEYGCLFRDSPMPMFITDCKTFRILAANSAALKLYGYTQEEFSLLTLKNLSPSDEWEIFLRLFSTFSCEYEDAGRWRLCKKSGDVFYAHIYMNNIKFERETARLIMTVDIDKKIKTERRLREKTREMDSVLNSVTDAFYTVNNQWEFTYVNNAYEKLLGRKREDIIGKNIWELSPYAIEAGYYDRFLRATEEKTSVQFEAYVQPKKLWVSVSAYPNKRGFAVFLADITEQKKLRDKILQNEQNISAILNNTKDIIWLVDKHFNTIAANQAFEKRILKMTGKATEKTTEADYDSNQINTWLSYYKRAFAGESFKVIWTDNHGGKATYEEINFNPVYDQNNEVTAISCFSRDVTEVKEYEQKIEKQNEKLREIAWIQSHKVRAPLARILGLVQLFDSEQKDNPENIEIIEMLKQSAAQLDEIIHEISDQARLYEH